MATSVPSTNDYFQGHTPPSSPNHTTTITTTPITIAPCPNIYVGVSQPHISVAQSTPLYTESTSTTTITPPITVKVTDTAVGAFGVTSCPDFTLISPLKQDDPDTVFGDDRDDLQVLSLVHSMFKKKLMMMRYLRKGNSRF